MEQKHLDVSDKDMIAQLKADVKCAFSSGCIDFFPLHFVMAKCSRQKSNTTGSENCSWGQEGHRFLCTNVWEHYPNDRASARRL